MDGVETKFEPAIANDGCFNRTKAQNQPGDFQSDAQFFVFTGVIAWLGATAWLVIYVFFSQKYLEDAEKKVPMIVSRDITI